MKAKERIASADFGPNDLKILLKAFDNAWAQIAPTVGTSTHAIQGARNSLASVVLGLASHDTNLNADNIATAAVRTMRGFALTEHTQRAKRRAPG